jgi:hypothetical protein
MASGDEQKLMSSTFNRIDTGTLGENRYKEADKHPDVTGKLDAMSAEVIAAIAQGKPVRLAGWWKDGRDGKWLSLRVSVMRERAEQPALRCRRQQWPSQGPQSAPPRRAYTKPGTIEGNLALKGMDPDAPFDDDIPFVWALAFPAACLIASMVHGALNVIA